MRPQSASSSNVAISSSSIACRIVGIFPKRPDDLSIIMSEHDLRSAAAALLARRGISTLGFSPEIFQQAQDKQEESKGKFTGVRVWGKIGVKERKM